MKLAQFTIIFAFIILAIVIIFITKSEHFWVKPEEISEEIYIEETEEEIYVEEEEPQYYTAKHGFGGVIVKKQLTTEQLANIFIWTINDPKFA